ncbi:MULTISPECIES: BlaI/MecI/CopY family transcriptional regulator [unclassified Sedimentibacter]|uniref:BlaI/MecI/CopY family transcriptional regulator n=1 Tax=unclassified Sedimentibacter TaxID=2649220 RepID=UPI0027DFAA7E|nr:BlaI/MecI/CopY family transcriptional regulator [Sedimentibacter sp. MB35-C1]WMJ76885.1 BlaI/MecI/CopY family transcriptional regulator [Sedimentibacter sp. MB35-C1]
MNKQINISDSEWKVMCVLWEKHPLMSSQIIQRLEANNWKPNTIHTLLSRLENKKIIGVEKKSRFKEYYPLVSREECQIIETKSFIKKVYDGSIKMFLSSYINQDNLSQDDIEYLKKLIEEKELNRSKKND